MAGSHPEPTPGAGTNFIHVVNLTIGAAAGVGTEAV
jgi:hypothetical protein